MEQEHLTLTDERTCKDCGAVLGAGREDRQYCDDGCRTNFNNRKRRETQKSQVNLPDTVTGAITPVLTVPEYITRIQDILLKNRAILETLCDKDKPRRISLRDLYGKGFNNKYFTSEADPTETGNIYRFCFDYGYCQVDDKLAIVVCRKREVL